MPPISSQRFLVTGLIASSFWRGYNKIIKAVAKRNNTGWVDNARLVPHQTEYFVDRVHFTSRGAARMAENLLPAVLAQLRPFR